MVIVGISAYFLISHSNQVSNFLSEFGPFFSSPRYFLLAVLLAGFLTFSFTLILSTNYFSKTVGIIVSGFILFWVGVFSISLSLGLLIGTSIVFIIALKVGKEGFRKINTVISVVFISIIMGLGVLFLAGVIGYLPILSIGDYSVVAEPIVGSNNFLLSENLF